MKLINGKAQVIPQLEGMERAAALVIIITPSGNIGYLCHAWGVDEGVVFFDTVDDCRIQLHGPKQTFLVQCPTKGMTYELNGTCRELREEEKVVTLQ